MLSHRTDAVEISFENKVDAVAAELAAHRTNTDVHVGPSLIKEEGALWSIKDDDGSVVEGKLEVGEGSRKGPA